MLQGCCLRKNFLLVQACTHGERFQNGFETGIGFIARFRQLSDGDIAEEDIIERFSMQDERLSKLYGINDLIYS